MKRSPLKRLSRLRSLTGLKKNRKRMARRREQQFGIASGYRAFILEHRCAVPDCMRDERYTVPAHARSRGAGGTWRDTLPLCWPHHSEQHAMGVESFEKKYAISLSEVAARMVGQWERQS